MVSEAETKIQKVGLRHVIYLKTEIVNDSNFPFRASEALIVRIERDKLTIEKKNRLGSTRAKH